MVEVIGWVLNYIVIGAVVQLLIQYLAKVLESPRLDVKESYVTILLWPIAVLIFTWFFVKGILGNREE